MASTSLMLALLVQYVLITAISLCEGNMVRALYFAGASLITVAVLNLK